MPIKYVSNLTAADVDALYHFAWEHGRRWKESLRDEWMRACANLPVYVVPTGCQFVEIEYRGVLQRLRNRDDFGTRGLERFRLPLGFAFRGRR